MTKMLSKTIRHNPSLPLISKLMFVGSRIIFISIDYCNNSNCVPLLLIQQDGVFIVVFSRMSFSLCTQAFFLCNATEFGQIRRNSEPWLSFLDFDPEFSCDFGKSITNFEKKTRFRSRQPEFLVKIPWVLVKIPWVLSFFRPWVLSVLHKK